MIWRLAHSLTVLRDEVNAAVPNRSKASDGTIGDPRHQGTGSDHNPNSEGVVCALDITHDPAGGMDAHALADHLRSHRHPQLKYIISDWRIASSRNDWTWRTYTGVNGHSSHIHVSVGVGPSGQSAPGTYDSTASWGVATAPAHPTPSPPSGGTGTVNVPLPVLRRGAGIPTPSGAVRSLQGLLNVKASQHLVVDGQYGERTEDAVIKVQAYLRLQVDGVVGRQTWGALFL